MQRVLLFSMILTLNSLVTSCIVAKVRLVTKSSQISGPQALVNTGLTLVEQDNLSITSSELDFNDSDTVDSSIVFTIVTVPSHGDLYNTNSATTLTASDTFTMGDITLGRIEFRANQETSDSVNQADAFTFTVSDGTNTTSAQTFNVTILPFCTGKAAANAYNNFGSGATASPYYICTAQQLNNIGAQTGAPLWAYYRLRADIDLSSIIGNHNIIGNNSTANDNSRFKGTFDGNGHTVSNFTYNDNTKTYVGLFGYVISDGRRDGINDGHIEDLNMTSVAIQCHSHCGALVGYLAVSSIIEDVMVSGSVSASGGTGGSVNVGGIVGYGAYSGIVRSSSSANVASDGNYLGGIIGRMENSGHLILSSASGNVTSATSDYVGGIAGQFTGNIRNSFATGNVSGDDYVGGFVGHFRYATIHNSYAMGDVSGDDFISGFVATIEWATIKDSYARGDVTGDIRVASFLATTSNTTIERNYATGVLNWITSGGGFIANMNSVTASDNFWDTTTTGSSNACDGCGGSIAGQIEGKTTVQMQTLATFTAAGWDFVGESANGIYDPWGDVPVTAYPRLWTEVTLPSSSLSGSGTADDPYLIADSTDLATFSGVR